MQHSVAKLSWRHNITLLHKLKTQEERLWYTAKACEYCLEDLVKYKKLSVSSAQIAEMQKNIFYYLAVELYYNKLRRHSTTESRAHKVFENQGSMVAQACL